MKNEKLLLIGAGIGQLPLLQRAKSKGINVTVATIPGEYPCIPLADDVIYKDIYDRDGIVEEARKRGINAVASDQNDLMNPTVAYVAEKLGLPGNSFSTVLAYCNKNLFRDYCEKVGVPVPRHIAVNSIDYDFSSFDCPFPWIVKPADSQSSIGVKRINTINELIPALKVALEKSYTNSAIVEEFFEGQEIVCEGFIENGEYYNLALGDRKYFELNNLYIPSQTLFPSIVSEEILNKVIEYEKKMAYYMEPSFAIIHSEYLVNLESGEIRIVESALRGGGVYISSDLIPMATGIDINEVLLNKVLGYTCDIKSVLSRKENKASGYVCFYLPDGVVHSIEGVNKLKQLPFVKKVYVDDIEIGEKTQKMTYKGARKGPILIQANNRAELMDYINVVQKTLRIYVQRIDGNIDDLIWC